MAKIPNFQQPRAQPVGPVPQWVMIVGAIFGAIDLLGLFFFAYLASANPLFVCNSFTLLAAIFAFGAALAAAFIGGAAAINGQLGGASQSRVIAFTAGGGIAVFFIAFFVFHLFKPNDCKTRQVRLEFDRIPVDLKDVPDSSFWVRRENQENLKKFKLSILAPVENSSGELIFTDPSGEEICQITIDFRSDLRTVDSDFPSFNMSETYDASNDAAIRLTYARKNNKDLTKAIDPSCFIHREKSVIGGFFYSHSSSKYRFGDGPRIKPISKQAALIGSPASADATTAAGRIFSMTVFAQNGLPKFSEIKQNLSGPNDIVRVQTRQFLAKNYKTYKDDALQETFSATAEHGPYLASLVSAMTDWIGNVAPALAPGKKRDLSLPLPAGVAGREWQIIQMTDSPSDLVKRQARRLIQRYPVDSFNESYMKLLNSDAVKQCSRGDATIQGTVYSAIFFGYNRIIQKNYADSLSPDEAQDAETTAKAIRDPATRCLRDDLAIDAALLDFGLATIYAEDGGRKFASNAKEAARRFLTYIKNQEDMYYFSAHIDAMRKLSSI